MPESFLRLPLEQQTEILTTLATRLGREAILLEKDVWVCWVLEKLFGMPKRPRLAFRGGTALSKVYDAIHRFSEDVDVSLDYRDLGVEVDLNNPPQTNKQRTEVGAKLRDAVKEFSHGPVQEYFDAVLGKEFPGHRLALSEDGERLEVFYPTLLETRTTGGYISSRVLIEFGGRNPTDPNTSTLIKPYIAEVPDAPAGLRELVFPQATVDVLVPERTFWEKVTLIHMECNRATLKENPERTSRHWYDIYMLADHPIGARALQDRELLERVVKHKNLLYYTASAQYERCLDGGLKLIPSEPLKEQLKADYQAMIGSQMFYLEPPTFEGLLERLAALEKQINSSVT